MARLARLAVPGLPHHLIQRGLNRQPIVADDQDRQRLLDDLRECAATYKVQVHAYVLMDNHLHLLATPETGDGLSRMMQALGRRYVAAFNKRHGRSGTLWDGRFRAAPIEASTYLLACMRYLELNPQRAQLGGQPADYLWSSAAHHLGLRRDPLVYDHALFWAMGNTPFEREMAWRQWLEQGCAASEWKALTEAAHKGWPLGSAAFLKGLADETDRPVQPRKRGRPAGRRALPAAVE
ncbi:transposase [Pelomonas sp. SE-A7]|uniref:transposase n=1 Tax=Pelomonas sp. SE-A7 TaxID=3054953 RepID=UPI00259CC7A3|nr:transposase [Pelomonas sp. SE-A7]MDM4767719.1 transposase [Pelomonas sp. SE-A7]